MRTLLTILLSALTCGAVDLVPKAPVKKHMAVQTKGAYEVTLLNTVKLSNPHGVPPNERRGPFPVTLELLWEDDGETHYVLNASDDNVIWWEAAAGVRSPWRFVALSTQRFYRLSAK